MAQRMILFRQHQQGVARRRALPKKNAGTPEVKKRNRGADKNLSFREPIPNLPGNARGKVLFP